jgi:hypothetical protein
MVGWLLTGVILQTVAPARADGPVNDLTPEEKKLAEEAKALDEKGYELYGQGKYVEATKALEQALRAVSVLI